ncbi:hypothetical protein LZQ00_09345 [Sphingobacterium sp. SRCM116780]|uniref:hypothetical protein n=1 Tax=Sphingobacterium sp. SRCM116780 TaxID=2907623 RepID=UPI001F2D1B37|nr:hypothetical protein [Sphingobacterium sp. SRCM116780]UIR54476.1 hypothetical protein LZQ00_09345 [Sphingobacterium sp. SRCM116780]
MQYISLIREGNGYRIKNVVSPAHVIFVIWLLVGIGVFVYSSYTKTGLSVIAFTLLVLILMILRSSKTRIIPDEKIIKIDTGIRGKEPIQYSFSDFISFELETVYYLRIPLNTELYGRFSADRKTNRHLLGQSFGKGGMQQLSNELEEFLKS